MQLLAGILIIAGMAAAQLPQDDRRVVFSTYHGGDRNDDAAAVAVDQAGYVYVTGETESTNLSATPVGGKPLTSAVFYAFLTKYAPGGKQIVWRYQIGGGSNTVPHALALDKDGNVYLSGTTGARDLPLVSPVQDKQTGLNIAFLMKFNPEGKLLFSTYFGGERNEEGLAIVVDSRGNIYLGGRATSTNLPVKNALQPTIGGGGQDGFVAKFTPDYKLEYATYLGGTSGTDTIVAMATGPDDSLFVTGESMSPGLATDNAWVTQAPSYSSYVAKINPSGTGISYWTYVGHRSGYTTAQAITVDSSGRAYVAGNTTAKQLPTTENAIQPKYAGGMRDAFLLRLSTDGTTAEYLTYLGGSYTGTSDPDETASAVKIDSHGYVYVAGETSSQDFPGKRSPQPSFGGVRDAYLLRLDTEGNQIVYSTFWGGDKADAAMALYLGPGEAATIGGYSSSANLPVASAVQSKPGSARDAFVAQICDPGLTATSASSFNYTLAGDRPLSQVLDVTSGCSQPFPTTDVSSDQTWLVVTADSKSVPMKLKLDVNPDGLTSGEYKAMVRVTVPDAWKITLEIPVVLTVAEPVSQ